MLPAVHLMIHLNDKSYQCVNREQVKRTSWQEIRSLDFVETGTCRKGRQELPSILIPFLLLIFLKSLNETTYKLHANITSDLICKIVIPEQTNSTQFTNCLTI